MMRESLYGIDSGHPQAELRNALHLGPELLRRSAVARALAKGALIDAPTMSDGSTLLMVACSCGHTDRVRLLCEFGADGEGPFADLIAMRFRKAHARLGYGRLPELDSTRFVAPRPPSPRNQPGSSFRKRSTTTGPCLRQSCSSSSLPRRSRS